MVLRLTQSLFEQEFSHYRIVVADVSFGLGDLIKDIEVVFVLLADDHQIFSGDDSREHEVDAVWSIGHHGRTHKQSVVFFIQQVRAAQLLG